MSIFKNWFSRTPSFPDTITYCEVKEASNYLRSKLGECDLPKVLIICGSGLSNLSDSLPCPKVIPYSDIPNFPRTSTQGHGNELVFGQINGVKVVCMKGRFHYYEGHSLQQTAMPVRVMKLLGVKYLIVTNSAGSLNETYNVGDVMLIKDHINWLGFGGQNPMRGPNDERFGMRFFPVNRVYDRELLKKARKIACYTGLGKYLQEGIYTMVGGPHYETIAEVNCLRACGADAVGMSTIPEVLTAAQCGMKVFGFSLISNKCVNSYEDDTEPNHEEVLRVAGERSNDLKKFVSEFVSTLLC